MNTHAQPCCKQRRKCETTDAKCFTLKRPMQQIPMITPLKLETTPTTVHKPLQTSANETTVLTQNGVRISRIILRKEPAVPTGMPFVVFRDDNNTTWKGLVPDPCGGYEYDLAYRVDREFGGHSTIRQILHVKKSRRIPMTANTLIRILCADGTRTRFFATKIVNGMSNELITVSAAINAFGTKKWYKALEADGCYINKWYVDELCPPFERGALASATGESLAVLVRTIVKKPWCACFWWMCGSAGRMLQELDSRKCTELARRIGAPPLDDNIALAIDAYHGDPFGRARKKGQTRVSRWKAEASVGMGIIRVCIDLGIINTEKVAATGTDATSLDSDPEKLVVVGDVLCEEMVVHIIVGITTGHADAVDLVSNPSQPNGMPNPTHDQQIAISSALRSRFHVVSGKPGTGKTSVVMLSVYNAFRRGTVLPVAFTGMAARHLRKTLRCGVTAHKVVDLYRRKGSKHKYANRSVLIIEEASTMSMRLLYTLLDMMKNTLSRIYVFGDHRQMPPTDGGPSLIGALVAHYAGCAPLVSSLNVSMRVDDSSGVLVANLDAIHAGSSAIQWDKSPETGHPFVFMKRGSSMSENVAIVASALKSAGVDPTDTSGRRPDWQIMVSGNEIRREFGRMWFEHFGKTSAPGEHHFIVGERIMFTRNENSVWKPRDAVSSSSVVYNGMTAMVTGIFDEHIYVPEKKVPTAKEHYQCNTETQSITGQCGDYHDDPLDISEPDEILVAGTPAERTPKSTRSSNFAARTTALTSTNAPKGQNVARRWMQFDNSYDVCINHYGLENIERIPPATVDKMQGQEADVCVLLLTQPSQRLGRRGVYTACSRARKQMIIVSDMAAQSGHASKEHDADKHPTSDENQQEKRLDHCECPSADFMASIIANPPDESVSFRALLPNAEWFSKGCIATARKRGQRTRIDDETSDLSDVDAADPPTRDDTNGLHNVSCQATVPPMKKEKKCHTTEIHQRRDSDESTRVVAWPCECATPPSSPAGKTQEHERTDILVVGSPQQQQSAEDGRCKTAQSNDALQEYRIKDESGVSVNSNAPTMDPVGVQTKKRRLKRLVRGDAASCSEQGPS